MPGHSYPVCGTDCLFFLVDLAKEFSFPDHELFESSVVLAANTFSCSASQLENKTHINKISRDSCRSRRFAPSLNCWNVSNRPPNVSKTSSHSVSFFAFCRLDEEKEVTIHQWNWVGSLLDTRECRAPKRHPVLRVRHSEERLLSMLYVGLPAEKKSLKEDVVIALLLGYRSGRLSVYTNNTLTFTTFPGKPRLFCAPPTVCCALRRMRLCRLAPLEETLTVTKDLAFQAHGSMTSKVFFSAKEMLLIVYEEEQSEKSGKSAFNDGNASAQNTGVVGIFLDDLIYSIQNQSAESLDQELGLPVTTFRVSVKEGLQAVVDVALCPSTPCTANRLVLPSDAKPSSTTGSLKDDVQRHDRTVSSSFTSPKHHGSDAGGLVGSASHSAMDICRSTSEISSSVLSATSKKSKVRRRRGTFLSKTKTERHQRHATRSDNFKADSGIVQGTPPHRATPEHQILRWQSVLLVMGTKNFLTSYDLSVIQEYDTTSASRTRLSVHSGANSPLRDALASDTDVKPPSVSRGLAASLHTGFHATSNALTQLIPFSARRHRLEKTNTEVADTTFLRDAGPMTTASPMKAFCTTSGAQQQTTLSDLRTLTQNDVVILSQLTQRIDPGREGWRFAIAYPESLHLALATDQLGRILLLHTPSFRLLHMWKGYREAQVAWSVISSATTPDGRRDCLGAVFYVPRRGILELWDIAGLQRIGALMVGSGGQLVSSQPSASFNPVVLFLSQEKIVYYVVGFK